MVYSRPFKNRLHAGKQLARALSAYAGRSDTVVLALPRGGVPVGFAVARALGLPLDILLVRKLGVPGQAEYAMGAVGSGGVRIVNRGVVLSHHISAADLDAACARELRELARRERQFRGARAPPPLRGQAVVLVDDGLATGATMRAALGVARAQRPARLVVAVPVGAPDTCARLAAEVDELVCLTMPPVFGAVGRWYKRFEQVSDDEVQDLLAMAWRHGVAPPALPATRATGDNVAHKSY